MEEQEVIKNQLVNVEVEEGEITEENSNLNLDTSKDPLSLGLKLGNDADLRLGLPPPNILTNLPFKDVDLRLASPSIQVVSSEDKHSSKNKTTYGSDKIKNSLTKSETSATNKSCTNKKHCPKRLSSRSNSKSTPTKTSRSKSSNNNRPRPSLPKSRNTQDKVTRSPYRTPPRTNWSFLSSSIDRKNSERWRNNMADKVFQNSSYSDRQRPTISSVDQDASYEDLLEQYRRIKLELNHIKIEEKHCTNESSKKSSTPNKDNRRTPRKSSRSPIKSKKSIGSGEHNKEKTNLFPRRRTKSEEQSRRRTKSSASNNKSPDASKTGIPTLFLEEEEDLMELRRTALESRAKKLARKRSSLEMDIKNGREIKTSNTLGESPSDNYDQVDMDLDSDLEVSPYTRTDLSEVEMDTEDDGETDEDANLLREQLLKALESKKEVAVPADNAMQMPKENIPNEINQDVLVKKSVEVEKLNSDLPQERCPLEEISQRALAQKVPLVAPSLQSPLSSKTPIKKVQPQPRVMPRTPLLPVRPLLPKCQKLVINFAEDSSDSQESSSSDDEDLSTASTKKYLLAGLDTLLFEARQKSNTANEGTTPNAVLQLSKAQQIEYRKLKEEIARRKHNKAILSQEGSGSGNCTANNSEGETTHLPTKNNPKELKEKLIEIEKKLKNERTTLLSESKRMTMLNNLILKKEKVVRTQEIHVKNLREQLAMAEMNVSDRKKNLKSLNGLVEGVKKSIIQRRNVISTLEKDCKESGKLLHGESYNLPNANVTLTLRKRTSSNTSSIAQKKAKQNLKQITDTRLNVTVPALIAKSSLLELSAEKERLQKLEREVAQRLGELKTKSLAKNLLKAVASKPILDVSTPAPPAAELILAKEKQTIEKIASSPKSAIPIIKSLTNKLPVINSSITQCLPKKSSPTQESDAQNCQAYLSLSTTDLELPNITIDTLLEPEETKVFKPYNSCLLHLRSYRLNPNFKKMEGQRYCNIVNANRINFRKQLCKFDIAGTCNDDHCQWLHESQYTLTDMEKVIDLVAYSPEMAGITDFSDSKSVRKKLVAFVKKDIELNPKLSLEKRCQNIVLQIQNHLKLVGPNYASEVLCRSWRLPKKNCTKEKNNEINNFTIISKSKEAPERSIPIWKNSEPGLALDSLVTVNDQRYFQNISKREAQLESVLETDPNNVSMWLKLAKHYLTSQNEPPDACLTRALNTMSRALETNQKSSDLWRYYLWLYSQHPDSNDIVSMCQQALEYTSAYQVWWQYLELSTNCKEKIDIAQLIMTLLSGDESESDKMIFNPQKKDARSHALIEVAFYLCQLYVLTGNSSLVSGILEVILDFNPESKPEIRPENSPEIEVIKEIINTKIPKITSFVKLLTTSDKVLLWLVYAYFILFDKLPSFMFEQGFDKPGFLVVKEPFLICWPENFGLKEDCLTRILESAIENCNCDHDLQSAEASLMLYINLTDMKLHRNKFNEAVALCQNLLEKHPSLKHLRLFLTKVFAQKGLYKKIEQLFINGLKLTPGDPELSGASATFYSDRQKMKRAETILSSCIRHFYVNGKHTLETDPCILYRHLLKYDTYEDNNILNGIPQLKSDLDYGDEFMGYMWINYGLLLQCQSSSANESKVVLECSVITIRNPKILENLWRQYLHFIITDSQMNPDVLKKVVFRCISTMPSRDNLPFQTSDSFLNFNFHNSVLEIYLETLENDISKMEACKELLVLMPQNIYLILRLATLLIDLKEKDAAYHLLESNLTSEVGLKQPWITCIQLALEKEEHFEVHALYKKALTALPFYDQLWIEYINYEKDQDHKDHVREALEFFGSLGINPAKNLKLMEK